MVVICTGANTATLIDAKDEIIARSHCVGIIQLTPEEVIKYKDLPIVDDFEQGEFAMVGREIFMVLIQSNRYSVSSR